MKTLVTIGAILILILVFGMVEALSGIIPSILSLIFISLLIKTIVTESMKARKN